MQGPDFHAPGKSFVAQPGGQVGGGGGSVGIQGGRGPPLGGLQFRQSTPPVFSGVYSTGQTALGPNIAAHSIQNRSISPGVVLHSSTKEMGKQTHLQNHQAPIPQVYTQNPNRSTSQANYYTNSRPPPSRNINHRNNPSANQGQVVGIPTVGATSNQSTTIFPHSNISMQPPTMYVPSQVSGLQTSPHQQNVFPLNSQMQMQFGGPPQSHQRHQNQFQYQSYQPALFAPSSIYGYPHGHQPTGFYYPQPPNAQMNLRGTASNVASSNQHVSTTLNSGTSLVSQGTLPQPTQPTQAMHAINMPIPQNEMYSACNTINANATRSKKLRNFAITDIVNPITGKNISDDIYKDDTTHSGDSNDRQSPQTASCDAELVVADFAARVAKLASESPVANAAEAETFVNSDAIKVNQLKTQIENMDSIEPNSFVTTCEEILTLKEDNKIVTSKIEEEPKIEIVTVSDNLKLVDEPLTSNIIDVLKTQGNIAVDKDEKEKIDSIVENLEEELSTTSIEDTGAYKTNVIAKDDHNQKFNVANIEKMFNQTLLEQKDPDKNSSLDDSERDIDGNHKKTNGKPTTESSEEVDIQKSDLLQKYADGKAMQKQKNKNKIKSKDLNRKVTEGQKEEIVMDAVADQIEDNASIIKIKAEDSANLSKVVDSEKKEELTKDVKEKDNYEVKKEQDNSEVCSQAEIDNLESSKIDQKITENECLQNNQINNQVSSDDSSPELTLETVGSISDFKDRVEEESLSSIIAQKNEENSKISGFCSVLEAIEDCCDNSSSATSVKTKLPLPLKYTYSDDQWSPINTSGKKVYDREFLMKLQNDPNSKLKPSNLPDLDVVLKDMTKTRIPVDLKLKEANLSRHDSLFPGFAKSSLSVKLPPPAKKTHSGKPKTNKPNVIHVSLSLREDVKLRETENAWKPTRLLPNSVSEEQSKTEALYKKVRSVLNKLTPQKFETLVNQVRELEIDTQERLQGVINLVFEKAVDEPNFSVAYALMCKELSNMHVTNSDIKDSSSANFRKLILTRCQTEFVKANEVAENVRSKRLKEIEECTDPEKKKEMQNNFEEEERRMRIKSVGNIRFIGELFKQNMLTSKIMNECIEHLLKNQDEENLECLCKLLTTIGKVLESKNNLSDYFKQMQQIANQKGKTSSRIRFMLQDVIDLRNNKWIPRRDDSNPKTIDQIQKEAESERFDIQLNNTPLNTPRKEDRSSGKRNRGNAGQDDGWIHPVSRTRQPVYSIEPSKLKSQPPSVHEMQLGSKFNYQWPKVTTPNKYCYLEHVAPESDKKVPVHLSGPKSTSSRDYGRMDYKTKPDDRSSKNGNYLLPSSSSNKDAASIDPTRDQNTALTVSSRSTPESTLANPVQLSEEQFNSILKSFLEEYIAGEEDIEEAVKFFKATFPVTSHTMFVRDIINAVLEKSEYHLNKTSQLLAQLLSNKCITLHHLKKGLGEILESATDLILDIPKLWKYFAKILVYSVITNELPLLELKTLLLLLPIKLRDNSEAAIFIAELLSEMRALKGNTYTLDAWMQNKLQWSDFTDNPTKVDLIISNYELEFLNNKITAQIDDNLVNSNNEEKFHEMLLQYIKNKEFDDICKWIQEAIGDKIKEPIYIRILMTAILESSVEQCNEKWIFKAENFDKLRKLIQRYVDADDYLELQCLFAVQAYIHKLKHPSGLIVKIMNHLYENNVLSTEAFLTWEKYEDSHEKEGKSEALLSLKSFFTPLKEVDISSGDEA